MRPDSLNETTGSASSRGTTGTATLDAPPSQVDVADHHDGHVHVREEAEARRVANRERLDRKERRVFRLAVALVVVFGLGFTAAAGVATISLVKLWERDKTIAALTDKLDGQSLQLDDQTAELSQLRARTGELADQVVALQGQVAELGGKPVVSDTPSEATTTTSTTSTTTPDSGRSPPPTNPGPSPPRACLPVAGTCVTVD